LPVVVVVALLAGVGPDGVGVIIGFVSIAAVVPVIKAGAIAGVFMGEPVEAGLGACFIG